MGGSSSSERARVSIRLGPETTDRTSIVLRDGTITAFGRGIESPIRFGHAPILDREVPRVAGWLLVSHGRVTIEAAPFPTPACADDHTAGRDGRERVRRPLTIKCESGPPTLLAADWAISPADSTFTIVVDGSTRQWELDVAVRRLRGSTADGLVDDATEAIMIELNAELRAVLKAYAQPMLDGSHDPATHDEVADLLNYSRMSIRRRLDKIADEFYSQKLWMPDTEDTRVRVVEAALHHGLLRNTDEDDV